MRAQGWAEAEKAKAQRKPAAMREHEQIFGQAPSWPGNTRSAGSSSINRFTPPRRLSAKPSHPQVDPTTSSSTYLPVTKAWLRQLVLALVLICHSS